MIQFENQYLFRQVRGMLVIDLLTPSISLQPDILIPAITLKPNWIY